MTLINASKQSQGHSFWCPCIIASARRDRYSTVG